MSVDNLNNQFTSVRSGTASTTRVEAQFAFLNGVCGPTVNAAYSPVYQESGNFSSAPNSFQTLLDKNTNVQRIVSTIPNQKLPYVYYSTQNIGAGSN